ncbi:lipopolysaccharide/colanic/teichoic acid biosynthesis glycosyltransferase [Litoreibacter ponti]|uniref:Lipopolysaccharide/colanic/teichoic acid biosynthesis glycosyltransferase n=1 Tax=Litoreibacter ponti TaxID=1510457 RepID=A0A2T6BPF6_9RHOB|nr:sugar transferase [Litoreibacter ponti]PTX57932.1 lipopolysaccharide/colanic/teichoic acid biosynthesis glycosyltransferase [Litoreibacter ponti]
MDARLDSFDEDAQAIGTLDIATIKVPGQPQGLYLRHGKRLFDIALVLLFAPVVIPVIFTLAVVVWLDGGAPFFKQIRVGRGGRSFAMLKLRTMRTDAERALTELLLNDPAAALEWRLHQKLSVDPRITNVGRFLRRSSLDELPQLWNVLRGDMSLVGPRPMLENQTDLYPGTAYFRVRPGLTGPWQVFARNLNGFADRAKFDTAYAADVGFFRDLTLIFCTFGAVLRGTGQ